VEKNLNLKTENKALLVTDMRDSIKSKGIKEWGNNFAVWTMHSHTINEGPANASKYLRISTLVHCYMFRRFKAPSSGSSM
jgi:hypothetical protein